LFERVVGVVVVPAEAIVQTLLAVMAARAVVHRELMAGWVILRLRRVAALQAVVAPQVSQVRKMVRQELRMREGMARLPVPLALAPAEQVAPAAAAQELRVSAPAVEEAAASMAAVAAGAATPRRVQAAAPAEATT